MFIEKFDDIIPLGIFSSTGRGLDTRKFLSQNAYANANILCFCWRSSGGTAYTNHWFACSKNQVRACNTSFTCPTRSRSDCYYCCWMPATNCSSVSHCVKCALTTGSIASSRLPVADDLEKSSERLCYLLWITHTQLQCKETHCSQKFNKTVPSSNNRCKIATK